MVISIRHEKSFCSDLPEALAQQRATRPDVITSDRGGAERSGEFDALTLDPATRRVPVVVISALADTDLGWNTRAAAVFRKPFDLVDVRATVIRLARSGAADRDAERVDRRTD